MKKLALLLLPLLAIGGKQSIPIGVLPTSTGSVTPIAHCQALGLTSPLTSTAIDTTGATAIVVGVSWYEGASDVTVTDNKGNGAPIALTIYGSAGEGSKISYWLAPTVGTGHTFTFNGVGSTIIAASTCIYPLIGPTVFDFGTDSGQSTQTTTCQPNSAINPGAGSHTILTFFTQGGSGTTPTIDSSFNVDGTIAFNSGVNLGIGSASLLQNPGASVQPTWTSTGSTPDACSIASFH